MNLMNNLVMRIMQSVYSHKLPYKEVLKSITTSGTQYWTTPVSSITNTGKFHIRVNISSTTTTLITGKNPTYASNMVGLFREGTAIYWQNGTFTRVACAYSYDTDLDIVAENGKITVNDTSATAPTVTEFTQDGDLCIGTSADHDSRMTIGKWMLFQHYDGDGELDVDAIPVLDWSDNPCFYDRVSHTMMYHEGTGTLTYERWGMTEVDYIRETGDGTVNAPYIDTGVTATLGLTYKMKIRHTFSVTNLLTPMSVGNSSTNNPGISHYSSGPAWAVKVNGNWTNYGTIVSDTEYDIEYSQSDFIVNDVSKGAGYGTNVTSDNIYFFGTIWTNPIANTTSLDFYSAQILNGTELVRDYIPVVISGRAGLYDKVNNKMYYNANTSASTDFRAFVTIAGVLYEVGSSITSDGSQYIDTGIAPQLGQTLRVRTECLTINLWYLFQSRVNTGNIFGLSGSQTNATILVQVGGTNTVSSITRTLNHIYDVSAVIGSTTGSAVTLTVIDETNGTTATDTGTVGTGAIPSGNIILSGNNSSQYIAGTYMLAQIKDSNGTLVRDYLPMMRVSDSKPGMMDMVEKSFYTNANTSASTDFDFMQCQASS